MRWIFPGSWYVDPVLITGGGRDPQTGAPLPEDRVDLPRALFAPGASTEEGLLSEVATSAGRLFFEDPVDIKSNDLVEIPEPFGVTRWQVDGHPKFWPLGMDVVVSRAS